MGQKLALHKCNPKAVDRQALLGSMDMDTRLWSDGILTSASRQAVREAEDTHTWIICDGDVDPEWVESLNSVLDDNRLLTMPNGERIQFGPNINFIFETHNLSFASPATVSRMGMIFLSDETLDINPIIDSWILDRPQEIQDNLKTLVYEYLPRSILWVKNNCESVVESTKLGTVLNGLSHVKSAKTKLAFIYGIIRGLSANLHPDSRVQLANEILSWANEPSADSKRPLDFFVNDNLELVRYSFNDSELITIDRMKDLDRLPVIETQNTLRSIDMITPWILDGSPFIVIGPEGCGKSTLLHYCFSKVKSARVAMIHCNANTKSAIIIQRLEQCCICTTTIKGRVIRPKDADKLILYLKDINLPKPDKYDTVEIIQLLQQMLTYNGYYDSSLEWITIENIQIVCSMNPPTTIGRHKLSTRFTSIVRMYCMSYSDNEQLQQIYKSFLRPVIDYVVPGHKIWSLPKNISKLAGTLVSIYQQTFEKFTIDMQQHYIFTPRDISRLVFSLGRYVYSGNEEKQLIDTVAYESQRIFQDRLVGAESCQKFQNILFSILRSDWDYEGALSNIIYSLVPKTASEKLALNMRLLSCVDLKAYESQVSKQLLVYERDFKDLHISIFPELLNQVSRIERVLGQSGGSLLLAGRPGISYPSIVTLACNSLGYSIITPKVGRAYHLKSFISDIKQALQIAGRNGEDVVFLLEDHQIVDSRFMEVINTLLSGSEVSSIFQQDELGRHDLTSDSIISTVKDSYSEEGFRGSIYEYLVSRVRQYLHIIIIFDNSNPKLSLFYESNPALCTRCQMQWISSWSSDSMNKLATETFIKSKALQSIKDSEGIVKEMMAIHQSCHYRGATPKHFIEFISMYDKIFMEKKDYLLKKQNYLEGGLKKLNEAGLYVDQLSNNAKTQQIVLADKQRQADSALKEITDRMVEASEQKKEMESLNVILKEEEATMLIRKQKVEKELAEVEPIIKSAKAAVGEIRSDSLSEIRSLRAPPPAIRDVLEGVLRLMGNLDMSWNSMKGFLGKRNVKEEIMNFDVRNISKQTRDAVAQLLKEKKESFEESVIKRSSVAAAPLALWVKANFQYAVVVERVAPMEVELDNLTQSLNISKSRVNKLKDALSQVDQKVAELKEGFGTKTMEAETLRFNLEKAMEVIKGSHGLMEKLSGEGGRWSTQVAEIQVNLEGLPRIALLATAFVVYLANASEDVREYLVKQWCQITNMTQKFNFCLSMSTESEQLIRKSQGLPSDVLSNENAIILLNNKATPLIIDPSGQAVEWLKNSLNSVDKKPELVNQNDDNFLRSLELAVRFGKTLIVQQVTRIEAVLMPLIRKEYQKIGPRFLIDVGDKSIDFNENFSLYLVSNHSSFSLSPEVVGFVNDINFTITKAGLSGQLLGQTLKNEKPKLEVQKLELLKQEEDLKIQLSKLEDQLLNELADSEGNILDNKRLISSLEETKVKSNIIEASLAESQKVQQSLDEEREKYAPISSFGSNLYFVVKDLQKLNHMYQFSLASFMQIYEKALKIESGGQDSTDSRVNFIKSSLQKLVYRSVSRSVMKSDRHTFALYLIMALHPSYFESNEWEIFSGQFISPEVTGHVDFPKWVPREREAHFKQLSVSYIIYDRNRCLRFARV